MYVVYRVSDVRQIEIHTGEPLVPYLNPFEVEIAIAKLEIFELPCSDQRLGELIQVGGETLQYENHKLISFFWSMEK
jgi:hypothetical protein